MNGCICCHGPVDHNGDCPRCDRRKKTREGGQMSETLYSGHVYCAKCGKPHWMYGPCGDVATITTDSTEPPQQMRDTPTPHNPDNLTQETYFGYRLLDSDEIVEGPLLCSHLAHCPIATATGV